MPNPPDHFVVMAVTAGYLGATPATWDVLIPDFTGASGFDASWMLVPGTSTIYESDAFSGRSDFLFGALPAANDFVRIGYRAAISATAQQFRRRAVAARSLPIGQYFRR